MKFYGSGVATGTVDVVNAMNDRLRLEAIPATVDKFQRAQPVAAAWNAGKVLVPRDAPWLDDFIREVASFTGLGDRHDDQVDALAAAFDSKTTAVGAGWERYARQVILAGGGIVPPEQLPEAAPEEKAEVIQ
jgi:phage terminase large subunit-like protein